VGLFDNHALFHQARREEDRAEACFLTMTRLAPHLALPWINLASFYFDRGDYARTRAAANRALRCRNAPDQLYSAYAYLALADRMEGRLDDALKNARVVVALKPHDGKTHRLLASVFLDRGENDAARLEMERTLARGYHDPDTVVILASLYRDQGRDDDAFELLASEAHRYYDAGVVNAYALALIDRGRYLDAKRELERAARVHPESAEIRENLQRLRLRGY
jgi:tetratricopeptide (TPR) repeat protein